MPNDLTLPDPARGFPLAQVPGAQTLAEVFAAWKARGLTPVEVTREQFIQRISIEHDTFTGQMTIKRDGADPLQTIGLLWEALIAVARDGLFASPRPNLTSGKAAIALTLDGNTIQAIHDPPNDPVVLTGLLVADLLHLCNLTSQETNAARVLASLIQFEIHGEPHGHQSEKTDPGE